MPAGRPRLTLDLDGVLCRPPFGINPGKGRNKRRDAPGRGGLAWRTEPWRYAFRRPMPGAVEGIAALSERFECHVVSARATQGLAFTERWFARYFGAVPPLHLRPSWQETPAQFKVRVTGELGPVAHFEDDPHTALWLAELLPAVFLVDWPRNGWLAADRIHRISRLAEARPILESIVGQGRPSA